jgi:hypothetical protein
MRRLIMGSVEAAAIVANAVTEVIEVIEDGLRVRIRRRVQLIHLIHLIQRSRRAMLRPS